MATNATSMISRIAALEARMAAVESENEMLKASLEVSEAPAKKAKKAVLTPEEKAKKTTNPEGPAAWNAFIVATWREMAAEKGVVCDDYDAFKKAAGAVGITGTVARSEAARRKRLMEGKEPIPPKELKAPKEPKAAAPTPAASAPASSQAESPAASAPPSPKAAVVAAPKRLPVPTEAQVKAATLEYDDEMRNGIRVENEGYGWEAVVAGGQAGWLDPSSGEVHSYDGSMVLGAWDAATGVFTSA